MTYDASESGHQSGSPVELYLYARGEQVWRFNSGDADIVFEGDTWTAAVIQRSPIETTAEQARNALTTTVARDFEVADLFRISPPTDVISLTLYRYHRSDVDEEAAVIWMGRVLNVEWSGSQARMNHEPISLSLSRTGLRRLYQRSCPHVLYGTACGIDKADHAHACEVTAIDGVNLTVDSLESKPYAGGFVEFEVTGGNLERRFIRRVSGLTLILSQPFQDLEVSDTVTVYPGCDHTMATCNTTYANLANYGGQPFIPSKNPFDGNPVY